MNRQSVSSKNVASIGYDEANQTLEIGFLSGPVYQYYNVPSSLHQQMMQASSKGKFLHQYIKNAYPYSRV